MTPPKKWQLISKKDISPHKWFPLEIRKYRLPDGKIVNDFTVTTIADVAMIIPVTQDKKIILVNQYKPGIDDVVLEFPAGRKEAHHKSLVETAREELKEEVGILININQLRYFATLAGFVTKGSEKVHFYFASNLTITGKQSLDTNERIEIVKLSYQEMDDFILKGKIWTSQTTAGWELAKKHFPKELHI